MTLLLCTATRFPIIVVPRSRVRLVPWPFLEPAKMYLRPYLPPVTSMASARVKILDGNGETLALAGLEFPSRKGRACWVVPSMFQLLSILESLHILSLLMMQALRTAMRITFPAESLSLG